MKFALLTVLSSIIWRSQQQDSSESNTCFIMPNWDEADCVEEKDCPFLYTLSNEERSHYVGDSQCEGEKNVCCPRTIEKVPKGCGENTRGSHLIMNGKNSTKGQWPWMAAIGYKDVRVSRIPKEPKWLCGGSLISRRYILTAAHCLVSNDGTHDYRPYVVRLGGLNLFDSSDGINVEIEKIVKHKNYSASKNLHDIAMFRLKEEVTLSESINTICLPEPTELRLTQLEEYKKDAIYVAGYGANHPDVATNTNILSHVKMKIMDNFQCRKKLERKKLPVTVNEDIVCAVGVERGRDSCHGDSGGPLMFHYHYDRYYALGIVSYGYGCGKPGFPGLYTKVTRYTDWINKNIEP